MNVLEILIGLFFEPLTTIFDLITHLLGSSVSFAIFIFAVIMISISTSPKTSLPPPNETKSTRQSNDKHIETELGVHSPLSSESNSECDADQKVQEDTELKIKPKAEPELNFDALGSLIAKEITRPKDDESERLTVKKGIDALGGLDAIDAFLSKKDKS